MATVKSREEVLEEKRKHLASLREEIEKRSGKTVEELYEEREKRVKDVVELREPDRVPVRLSLIHFPGRYAGIPKSAAYYDAPAWREAIIKAIMYLEPDLCRAGAKASGGEVLGTLDSKQTKWPGGQLPDDVSHQAIDLVTMKEDEYDLFLDDPTDFLLRYYLPRAFGTLGSLSKVPSLTDRFTGFPGITPIFTREEFKDVARALLKAGNEQSEWNLMIGDVQGELASLGYPPCDHPGGAGGPPFDFIVNNFRGYPGIVTDMYRRPEKLIAACEKIAQMRIAKATPSDPNKRGNPKLASGGAIHRGADNFLSKKQFETFYWPSWKKALMATIDLGFVVTIFAEGFCDDRLEHFLELPKGKAIIYLDQTDMVKAKQLLGKHLCLQGGVPSALLQIGSVQEVEEHCKSLIRACGKGGGFILSHSSALDEAKPANLKAMMDSVKKYGWS